MRQAVTKLRAWNAISSTGGKPFLVEVEPIVISATLFTIGGLTSFFCKIASIVKEIIVCIYRALDSPAYERGNVTGSVRDCFEASDAISKTDGVFLWIMIAQRRQTRDRPALLNLFDDLQAFFIQGLADELLPKSLKLLPKKVGKTGKLCSGAYLTLQGGRGWL